MAKYTITVPDETAAWFDNYCKTNGHKISTYIAFLIQRLKEERESIGVGSAGPIQTTTQDKLFPKKLAEIVDKGWNGEIVDAPIKKAAENTRKKLSTFKSDTLCPHGIAISGYCKSCK